MHIVTADDLHSLVERTLLAAGADERNATRVADALVSSNLSGVDTHGVFHLPRYVEQMQNGEIVPTAWPEVVSETPTSALVKGNWGFGYATAKFATETAIGKAREHGISVVGAVQTGHIGRLGEYAEMAAAEGMIGQVWASGYGEEEPVAVPYGGSEAVLHTNPISLAFPAGDEPSLMLDFATTTAAGSKVLVAQKRGLPIPEGWMLDKHGNPTTDPGARDEGGVYLPFGGHKGYAIMLANELLGRVLTGSDAYAEPGRGGPVMRHQGVTFIVLKADLFRPLAEFAATADELGQRMRAVPPAPGFDEVLVPGDMEARARAERQRDGIPVPDEVWASLIEVARSLGVETQG